jgi:hypothetical protein
MLLTMRDLIDEYLDLCRNPLKNVRRWIKTKPKRRSAHEPGSTHSSPDGHFLLRDHPLPTVKAGWTRTSRVARWRSSAFSIESHRAARHHELQPLSAEGRLTGPFFLLSDADERANAASAIAALESEL